MTRIIFCLTAQLYDLQSQQLRALLDLAEHELNVRQKGFLRGLRPRRSFPG